MNLQSNRFRIFLTNSLEEYHPDTGTLFASWLSAEANEANYIKRDTPIMCVIGNPPYNVSSSNNSEWIEKLVAEYKMEPGGKEKLKEQNPKSINDDYVKFIRYGQYFIEKNGSGILAFINPHGFLDNPTFRGMRWHLLKTFDNIYTIDLHGNSKKQEVCPDGSPDQNVFDIMQGVSINIFVKTGQKGKKELSKLYHSDLYGKREVKYDYLQKYSIQKIEWNNLSFADENYFFIPKDFSQNDEYNRGFKIDELFLVGSMGIATARDDFTIHFTPQKVKETITKFLSMDNEEARKYFSLGCDVRDWTIEGAKKDLGASPDFEKILPVSYRQFDTRFTFYTGNSRGFHCTPRGDVMRHFIAGDNIGLCCIRVNRDYSSTFFLTNKIVDKTILSSKAMLSGLTFEPLQKRLK